MNRSTKKPYAMLAAAFASIAVVASIPNVASAAQVDFSHWSDHIGIKAAPGETNKISVSATFDRQTPLVTVQIFDSSSQLELTTRSQVDCRKSGTHGVVCRAAYQPWFEDQVVADLDDGDDEFSVDAQDGRTPTDPGLKAYVLAGSGNDRVITGEGDDLVYGESGDDYVAASDGANVVHGDSGNDFLTGGNATTSGQSSVLGDEGNDLIVGSNSIDALNGGEGNDFINARNGDDTLDGGPGSDNLLGAEGDDTFRAADGEPDTLGCGSGFDLYTFDSSDDPSDDCESLLSPHRPTQPTRQPLW